MTKRTCSTPDCTKPHYGRGWCKFHYQRAYLSGNLEAQPRTLAKPTDSLDTRLRNIGWTVTDSGCWEWNGSRNTSNYGTLAVGRGRPHIASRIAFEAWIKVPDANTDICHRCDNPPCINPAHLFEGTRQENVTDMVTKQRVANGERKTAHKLKDSQVESIRNEYAEGGVSQSALARKYGVSQSHISFLVLRQRRQYETFRIAS
jgi:hypothetical protein